MFCYMKVLSTLLCLLLLHRNASANCSAGQRLNYNTNKCEKCPANQFSLSPGISHVCQNCNTCRRGSIVFKACTPTSDTQCKCKEGFTPINRFSEEICVCEKGSGIDERGICRKCEPGYFTDKRGSVCKRWRECQSGVKDPGTTTSDASCKNASEEVTEPPKAHTTTTTTTSTTTVSSSINTKEDSIYALWLVMASASIILLAGLLYRKCKVTYCIHNHKKVDFRKESVCRKPVEESGEKCQSLLV